MSPNRDSQHSSGILVCSHWVAIGFTYTNTLKLQFVQFLQFLQFVQLQEFDLYKKMPGREARHSFAKVGVGDLKYAAGLGGELRRRVAVTDI